MSKITLEDSMLDIAVKMSDGNPGALIAIMELSTKAGKIDPQGFMGGMGGMGTVLSLDTYEIYGSSIYILGNDKCQRDTRKMVMLLRATQLGILDTGKLQAMAADQMRTINLTVEEWADIDSKVCERLEEFQRP